MRVGRFVQSSESKVIYGVGESLTYLCLNLSAECVGVVAVVTTIRLLIRTGTGLLLEFDFADLCFLCFNYNTASLGLMKTVIMEAYLFNQICKCECKFVCLC